MKKLTINFDDIIYQYTTYVMMKNPEKDYRNIQSVMRDIITKKALSDKEFMKFYNEEKK